jgi:hypothetical protein
MPFLTKNLTMERVLIRVKSDGDEFEGSQISIWVELPTVPVVGDDIRFSNEGEKKPHWLITQDEEDWELLRHSGITITGREFSPNIICTAKIWAKSPNLAPLRE